MKRVIYFITALALVVLVRSWWDALRHVLFEYDAVEMGKPR
jgi:hypothetical protein